VALVDRLPIALEGIARVTRPLVEPHPRLRAVLSRARRKLPRPRPTDAIGQIIFEFGRGHPGAFFIQVGSNDGEYLDPLSAEIHARRWRGIMVEPVPYVFERLRANYGHNRRVILENGAIADVDGSRTLYHLSQAEPGAPLPEWYDKLGSFRRDVIAKHRPAIPDFDRRLVTIDVPCLTFDSLCRKHGVTAVDLVQMDTEGYDFEIVKLIDLDRLRPRLIMYEHLHFDDRTRRACSEHLERHGYEQLSDVVNTICLRTVDLTSSDRSLDQVWQRCRSDAAKATP
jgi:FkbM family methyltransferase